ncbi:MAG: universal stress protein [Mycobacteriales bacterium]
MNGNGPVLVGVTASTVAGGALDWAAVEAARRRVALRVVHAVAGDARSTVGLGLAGESISPLDERPEFAAAREVLAAAARRAAGTLPVDRVEQRLMVGPAALVLVAQAGDAALTVVGSRRAPHANGLLPSVAEEVAQHAPGPVVLVRGGPDHGGRVVAGLGGHLDDAVASSVLEFAFAEAALHRSPLCLLRPAAATGHYEAAEIVAGFRRRYRAVRCEDRPCHHHLADLLIEAGDEAGLLVVARRHAGIAALRDRPATRAAIRHARCPVAVVPG